MDLSACSREQGKPDHILRLGPSIMTSCRRSTGEGESARRTRLPMCSMAMTLRGQPSVTTALRTRLAGLTGTCGCAASAAAAFLQGNLHAYPATLFTESLSGNSRRTDCCTAQPAVLLRPLSCPGPAQAAQLDAGPAGGGDPRRVHPHALHRHGLRHLCMACGGSLPVLHQLPAPGRCQDLVQSLCLLLVFMSCPCGLYRLNTLCLPCFTTSISAGTLQIRWMTSSLAMSLLSLEA